MGGCCCDVGSVVMYLSISGHLISLLPGPAQLSVHPFLSFSSSSRTIWWGNRGSLSVPREDRRGLLCVFSHRLQLIRLVTAGYRWDMLYCTVLYCTLLVTGEICAKYCTVLLLHPCAVMTMANNVQDPSCRGSVSAWYDGAVIRCDQVFVTWPPGVKVWCCQVAVGSRSSALMGSYS